MIRRGKYVPTKLFKEADEAGRGSGLLLRKQFIPDEVRDLGERRLQFIISTDAVDRDLDTISVKGWDLEAYKRNPVILWAHDYKNPPIGRAEKVFVEDDKLKSVALFTDEDVNPLGKMVYKLFRDRFLNATSVGFIPTEWELNEERDGFRPTDFLKQELLEYSAVPVPSNPEALLDAKSAGIDMEPMRAWASDVLAPQQRALLREMSIDPAKLEELADLLKCSTTVDMGANGNGADKGTISFGSAHPDGTPLADSDSAWNGPREVAAAEVDDLKVMATWVESENDDAKSAFKLPHHRAAGGHSTVFRGVTAAMGALLGARGGVDIPDADRRGVYNHLARHYREFDRDPPEFRSYSDAELRDVFPDTAKGMALAAALNQAIDAMATEERSRADIIRDMAAAASVVVGTVMRILDGSINCPSQDQVTNFAQVLNMSPDLLFTTGATDGCTYGRAVRRDSYFPTEAKGAALAAALNRAIDAMVTDERSRADVIEAMGRASGISASTVNQILNGSINCPPLGRLQGFTRVLDVSMGTLTTAGNRDGCDYERAVEGQKILAAIDRLERKVERLQRHITAFAEERAVEAMNNESDPIDDDDIEVEEKDIRDAINGVVKEQVSSFRRSMTGRVD